MLEDGDLTLTQAGAIFEVDKDELYLMLQALEDHREADPNRLSGRIGIRRRQVRIGQAIETFYRREDIEQAIALDAARQLGFIPP